MDPAMTAAIATAVANALAARDAAEGANAVHHVGFKMPEFWCADPDMWFTQAEAAFGLSRITRSYTKFQHIVTRLPEAVMMSCRTLLAEITPDTEDAYEQLKEQLTVNFGKTRWQRGFAILDHPDLGDRRPSAMMTEMLALLPPDTVPELLFFCHFLRRLPSSMRDQLASSDHKSTGAMAAHADKIWDSRSATDPVATVTNTVDAVNRRSASPRDNRPRSPGRSPNRRPQQQSQPRQSRQQTPFAGDGRTKGPLCRNHREYGPRCKNCIAPCSWVTKN